MPLRPCNRPGCAALTEERFCPAHMDGARPFTAHVGSSTSRGYDSWWRKDALAFLSLPENALCAECARHGRVTAAGCVDHVRPWRSGASPEEQERLRRDRSNWQPLCDHRSPWNCHGRKTAREAQAARGVGPRAGVRIIAAGGGATGAPDAKARMAPVKIAGPEKGGV